MSPNGELLKNAELVFGLVAPIGTDANKVAENLVSQLVEFGYKTTIIKLSDFIEPMSAMFGLPCNLQETPEHDRILTRIKAANAAYQLFNEMSEPQDRNAMLALAAVEQIASTRKKRAPHDALLNEAHILVTLKRSEEVAALRSGMDTDSIS